MYLIHGWMEIVWQKFTKVGQWFTITIAVLLYNIYIYKDRSASHSFTESHQWTCCLPECHRISLKKSTPLKRHICCVLIYNNSPLSVEVKHGFCYVMIFCRHREAIKKIRHVFFFHCYLCPRSCYDLGLLVLRIYHYDTYQLCIPS